ncbi:MAG: ATP-binding cassette domain-containing protein [Candidatus Sericytochromatia bacterium]
MNILEINNLSKRYGKIQSLNNFSLKVEKGNVYGLLGPNGSGKTTTLGIVLGIINQDSGSYKWFEKEPSKESRKKIGAILETPNFYPYLSAVKNLQIVADIKNVPYKNIDEVLKTVNLLERKNYASSTYSLGMRQRLALASSLLADPDVLVLDEPTNGLDPQGIAEVREIVQEIVKKGKTIIIASHILDEIEKICTHVAVIKKGNLLVSGSIQDVLSKDNKIEVASDNLNLIEENLKAYKGIKRIVRAGIKLELYVENDVKSEDINKYLVEKNIYLSHLVLSRQSLEKTFLELTAE